MKNLIIFEEESSDVYYYPASQIRARKVDLIIYVCYIIIFIYFTMVSTKLDA